MSRQTPLTMRFEEQRPHLRAIAYRMLGSASDADDAVQEAWLRLERSDTTEVENLEGWLTTVVARICLNLLRSRRARIEDPLDLRMPELTVGPADPTEPEHEALVADSVGLAMLVVLETLSPAERLAFVLHDVFAVPFDEIAPILERSPAATRQLASRARRRVQGSGHVPDSGIPAQREVVDAFFAAARSGDLGRLVAVLHPDVVLRTDLGSRVEGASGELTGAEAVAARAAMFADPERKEFAVTINGAAGAVITVGGHPVSLMGFTVVAGRIAAIDVLGDPARLERVDLSGLGIPDR